MKKQPEMNEEIQPKLTDKGWAAMRDLLDKEMPVEQKRRRFIWWWLWLLLLPVAVLGYWRPWQTDSLPPASPAVKPGNTTVSPLPMTQHTNVRQSVDANLAVTPLAQKNTSPVNSPSAQAQPINGTTTAQTVISAAPVSLPAAPSAVNIGLAQPNTVDQNAAPVAPLSFTPVQAEQPQAPQIVYESVSLPVSINTPVHQQTPVQPSFPVVTNNLPQQTTPISPKPTHQSWKFGATTALGTEQFERINTLSAGLVVEWRPSRSFGLRSGIQYKHFMPTENYAPLVTVQPVTYKENVELDEFTIVDDLGNVLQPNTAASDISEPVIIPVTTLKMVELPMLFFYSPVRRLKIFTGVNTAYVLAATAGGKNYSGELTLNRNFDAASKSLNTLATNDIAKWRAQGVIGIGTQLGRHVELGLFYNVPLDFNKQLKFESLLDSNGSRISVARRQKPVLSLQVTGFF